MKDATILYETRIRNQLSRLNKRYDTKMVKRGLIRRLGPTIMCLKSNLHVEDQQRYNNQNNQLNEYGNEMKTVVQEQTSIFQESTQDSPKCVHTEAPICNAVTVNKLVNYCRLQD